MGKTIKRHSKRWVAVIVKSWPRRVENKCVSHLRIKWVKMLWNKSYQPFCLAIYDKKAQ